MTATTPLVPERHRPRRRLRIALVVGVMVAVVVTVLAVAVFEVQTLFIDDEVAEAGPVFESGATLPAGTSGPGVDDTAEGGPDATTPPSPAPPDVPAVTTVGTGTFASRGHPGEGTVTLLTDGAQAFVRFEDDFSTDNGPDLRVRAVVDGERIDLGELKGNRGAQNYELPAEVDPSSVTAIDVWCRRFDYVFTEATVT